MADVLIKCQPVGISTRYSTSSNLLSLSFSHLLALFLLDTIIPAYTLDDGFTTRRVHCIVTYYYYTTESIVNDIIIDCDHQFKTLTIIPAQITFSSLLRVAIYFSERINEFKYSGRC